VSEMTGTEIRRQLLKEVESCVCRNRQEQYGDAEQNFDDIAKLANVVLQSKLKEPLAPEDVALFSACIKMARIATNHQYMDSWIDLAGYAVCGGGIVMRNASASTSESDTQESPDDAGQCSD